MTQSLANIQKIKEFCFLVVECGKTYKDAYLQIRSDEPKVPPPEGRTPAQADQCIRAAASGFARRPDVAELIRTMSLERMERLRAEQEITRSRIIKNLETIAFADREPIGTGMISEELKSVIEVETTEISGENPSTKIRTSAPGRIEALKLLANIHGLIGSTVDQALSTLDSRGMIEYGEDGTATIKGLTNVSRTLPANQESEEAADSSICE